MATREPLDAQTGQLSTTFVSTGNTTAPISRLPFDVLTQIFLIYAQWCHYDVNRPAAQVPQWINVSHVCRCWREAALGFQTLWSYMFVASEEWTEALLARSGEVPSRIIADFCSSFTNREKAFKFMQQVLPHAGRLQECILHLSPEDVTAVLLLVLGSDVTPVVPMLSVRSGPLLRRLEITLPYDESWQWLMLAEENALEGIGVTMGSTFNHDTPALRELHLRNYPLSWCPQTLGGLKVLSLRDLCSAIQLTIAQLKSVLGALPDLERLELVNAVGGDYDQQIIDAEKVQLPRLGHLIVTGHLFRIAPLLFCLNVPLTTRVRVGCRLQTRPGENDQHLFFAFFSSIFGDCPWRSHCAPDLCHTLSMLQAANRMHIVVNATQETCKRPECSCSLSVDCNCNIPLKVSIEWPLRTEYHHDLVYGLCRSISLTSMQKLIVAQCDLHQKFWFDVIWHLQNLQHIQFCSVHFKDILHLLRLPARPHPVHTDMDPQVFVQSLKSLFLNDVMIERQVRCGGNINTHGGIQVAQFFGLLAERRKKVGHGLTRLSMGGNAPFSLEEVRYLEKLVPEVEFFEGTTLLPAPADARCEDCK